MLNKLIRFLGSIKLGITLIAAIAISSIWGSLIAADPKQGVDHAIVKVFGAPWFLILVATLALNLILCSWEKTVIAFSLPWRRVFANSAEFFFHLDAAARISPPPNEAELLAVLRRHFRFFHQNGKTSYAQKGISSRFGATVIHIGLLLVMGATIVRGLAGALGLGIYDGSLIANEGQTVERYFTRINRLAPANMSNLRAHPLPFSFRVLDFTAEKYPHSEVVRSFRALVEARSDQANSIAEISMARPFFWDGYKITLNSYSENISLQRVRFTIEDTSRAGAVLDLDAKEGDPVRIPSLNPSSDLFFEFRTQGKDRIYRVMDLRAGKLIEQGVVESSSGTAQAENLLETVKKLSEAFVVLGLVTAKANAMLDDHGTTFPLEAGAGLLLAYFSEGKLVDQQVLPMSANALTRLGSKWLLSFVPETGFVPSGGEQNQIGHLLFSSAGDASSSGSIAVNVGDILTVSYAADAAMRIVHLQENPTTSDSGRFSDKTTTVPAQNLQPAEKVSPQRFKVREAGTVPGYTVFFGIMRDPALPWFYFGCSVILIGVLLAFAVTYREVWVWHDETSGTLYIGLRFYRRESRRALDEFWQLVEALQRAGSRAERSNNRYSSHEDFAPQEKRP